MAQCFGIDQACVGYLTENATYTCTSLPTQTLTDYTVDTTSVAIYVVVGVLLALLFVAIPAFFKVSKRSDTLAAESSPLLGSADD
jgi:hypothetical protein